MNYVSNYIFSFHIFSIVLSQITPQTWYTNYTLGIAYLYHEVCTIWTKTNINNLCINTYNGDGAASIPTTAHWDFINSIIQTEPTGTCKEWDPDEPYIGIGADINGASCTVTEKKSKYKYWNGDIFDPTIFPWSAGRPNRDCTSEEALHFKYLYRELDDAPFNEGYAVLCQKIITINPTIFPTKTPTKNPTINPTKNPTINPTKSPIETPTKSPSVNPSFFPTKNPSVNPSFFPTKRPSHFPTITPTTENAGEIVDITSTENTPNMKNKQDNEGVSAQIDGDKMLLIVILSSIIILLLCIVVLCSYFIYLMIAKHKKAKQDKIMDVVGVHCAESNMNTYSNGVSVEINKGFGKKNKIKVDFNEGVGGVELAPQPKIMNTDNGFCDDESSSNGSNDIRMYNQPGMDNNIGQVVNC